MGEKTCTSPAAAGEPLVIDWTVEDRADVEIAMRSGIPVVTYDCTTLRLVKDCTLAGDYGFSGVSMKEQVIALSNADEIRANLPFAGASVVQDISAELARGMELDIATALVGKRRSTRASAKRNELSGVCLGATHFVRGASVGAFAMTTATRGEQKTAAGIFGAGISQKSVSRALRKTREGDLDACARATSQGSQPPERCDAVLRLELVPVDADAAAAMAAPVCPNGMALIAGKCTTGGGLCSRDNPGGCQTACNAGDQPSCVRVGALHLEGRAVSKDPARAATLFGAACDKGVGLGCEGLALMFDAGNGVAKDKSRSLALKRRGCELGEPVACYSLALETERTDPTGAAALFRRACDGGTPEACRDLADRLRKNVVVPLDPAELGRVDRRAQLLR